nr:BON domain-containing protein [Limnobacter parvus]
MPNNTSNAASDTSSDTWITAKVKTELLADDISKGFDIEVTTLDGVVSLDGKVKDSESIMHVQQIASSVEGVLRVDSSGLMLEEARAY